MSELAYFMMVLDCVRAGEWASAQALVPAAIGKETIDMCMCRVRPAAEPADDAEHFTGPLEGGRQGFPPSGRLPYALGAIGGMSDPDQLMSVAQEAMRRWREVSAAFEPHRPPQLVERLIEACETWKRTTSIWGTGKPILDALEALEDADIFRATPEPEPLLREEVEDDIPSPPMAEPCPDCSRGTGGGMPLDCSGRCDCHAGGMSDVCECGAQRHAHTKHAELCPSGGVRYFKKADDAGSDDTRLKAAGWKLCDSGYWAAPGDEAGSWSTVDALGELDSGTVNRCYICHGPNDRAQALSTRCSACHARAVHNRAVLDGIRSDTEAVQRGPRSSSR